MPWTAWWFIRGYVNISSRCCMQPVNPAFYLSSFKPVQVLKAA